MHSQQTEDCLSPVSAHIPFFLHMCFVVVPTNQPLHSTEYTSLHMLYYTWRRITGQAMEEVYDKEGKVKARQLATLVKRKPQEKEWALLKMSDDAVPRQWQQRRCNVVVKKNYTLASTFIIMYVLLPLHKYRFTTRESFLQFILYKCLEFGSSNKIMQHATIPLV